MQIINLIRFRLLKKIYFTSKSSKVKGFRFLKSLRIMNQSKTFLTLNVKFMLYNIEIYCHIYNYFRLYIVKDLLPSDLFEFNQGFYEN